MEFKVSEQLGPRFSNGCILCGKFATWKVKMLDPKNRPREICVDCLLNQRILKTVEDKNVLVEVIDEKPLQQHDDGKGEDEQREQPVEPASKSNGENGEGALEQPEMQEPSSPA